MYHGMKGPENNFQIYRAINDPCQATFVFWDFTMGNQPKKEPKMRDFQNLPKARPKIYLHETSA